MEDEVDVEGYNTEGDMFGRPDLFGVGTAMLGEGEATCSYCVNETGKFNFLVFILLVEFGLLIFLGSSCSMSVEHLHHHLLFYHSPAVCPFEVNVC
jgi:hypothetical protein